MAGQSKSFFHQAGRVMINPDHVLENGVVEVEDGIIRNVEPKKGFLKTIDHGSGVIMAAPINAHTHLELCALKGLTRSGNGMLPWVESLVEARSKLETDRIEKGLQAGVDQIRESGTTLVGDVCNNLETASYLASAPFHTLSFLELLGNGTSTEYPQLKSLDTTSKDYAHGTSLAGHALHTTPADTLLAAKNTTREAKLPFSLHLSESPDETYFLVSGRGPWADFLKQRGISLDIKSRGMSPVEYADALGLLDSNTLAVHLTTASTKDLKRIAQRTDKVCICPRSNKTILDTLPPLPAMLESGICPALGTDSLASNSSLNIWEEMAFAALSYPQIRPRTILEMATVNGARSLGCDGFLGDLLPGRRAAMVYIQVGASDTESVMERVVHQGPDLSIHFISPREGRRG